MPLDRNLQRQILEFLRASYPSHATNFAQQGFAKHPSFTMDVAYLEEHKLISGAKVRGMGHPSHLVNVKITAGGLDFLENDGGVGAILKTITVKFDAENIRSILQTKVLEVDLPEPEKQSLVDRIKNLSGDALKNVSWKLIEKAMENPTEIVRIINSLGL